MKVLLLAYYFSQILNFFRTEGSRQRLFAGLVQHTESASENGLKTVAFPMQITDPQSSGDVRIEFKFQVEQFVGKFIDFTDPDSGYPPAVIILFIERGHSFTYMTAI
jgi:hypothetical protein